MAANAPQVALMVKPESSGQAEAPRWCTMLLLRKKSGEKVKTIASGQVLSEPVVTFSRLTGYYWLRLQRKGEELSGYSSVDGKNWIKIGSVVCPLKKEVLVGLAVSSGLAAIQTTVNFDQVDLKKR